MKAVVVSEVGAPLEIRDVIRPEPGPGQVRVRIEASGLCRIDSHLARGEWPATLELPRIPGHEGVGIVDAVGDGVDAELSGRRVAIAWLAEACGTCEFCASGQEGLCARQRNTGVDLDGCHAEYLVADVDYVVAVPDGVDPLDAAPLTCAGVNAYKAVQLSAVGPGCQVAVYGLGGLGHLAVQYALIAGSGVIAVDASPGERELAATSGASSVIDASSPDATEMIQELGGVDAVIMTAATPASIESAFEVIRQEGTLVVVGLPTDDQIPMPIFRAVFGGLSVIGSVVGARQDLTEVFALHAAGRTTVRRETRRLDDANDAYAEVDSIERSARLVFDVR